MIDANDLNSGDVIKYEGNYHKVLDVQHVKKSRGQAFIQTKLRNLDTGSKTNNRFRSSEKVDRIHTSRTPMQFLYKTGNKYHFMDLETAEEEVISENKIEEAVPYLVPNVEVRIVRFEGETMGIELPQTVDLEVTDTPPHLEGASATDVYKPATLETGLETKVPPFVEEGETISIDTEDGSYVEKA